MGEDVDIKELLKKINDFQKSVERFDPNAFAKIGMQCVSLIIVELDTGNIYYSTPPVNELFGYMPEEITGKNILDLMPERFRGKHPVHMQKFSDHPKPRSMGEAQMKLYGITRDGVEFPIRIGLYPRVIEGIRFTVATILKIE